MQNDESVFPITNPAKLYLSKVMFKIIPFASEENYISDPTLCAENNLITCINAP
ncbi:hypothetical protein KKG31_06610 [Patescibacteria group bacterium]|nr:hypothetical protein [Patescibacteria group bacterium]MBU1758762.1 hypothetical protein [Patescibacteria group bacterium]